MAAITKYHRLDDLNIGIYFPTVLEAEKSKVMRCQWLTPVILPRQRSGLWFEASRATSSGDLKKGLQNG
jgi:hypothetical protein